VIRKAVDNPAVDSICHIPTGARRRSVPKGWARWVLSAPLLLFLTVFAVLPVFYGLWISLTDQSVLRSDISFFHRPCQLRGRFD